MYVQNYNLWLVCSLLSIERSISYCGAWNCIEGIDETGDCAIQWLEWISLPQIQRFLVRQFENPDQICSFKWSCYYFQRLSWRNVRCCATLWYARIPEKTSSGRILFTPFVLLFFKWHGERRICTMAKRCFQSFARPQSETLHDDLHRMKNIDPHDEVNVTWVAGYSHSWKDSNVERTKVADSPTDSDHRYKTRIMTYACSF